MPVSGDAVPPIEWANWRFGDWGSAGPEGTQIRWHGANCQVYEDGSLGPRPGWKRVASVVVGTGLVPRALVWRQPGPDEPNDASNLSRAGKRWLHVEGLTPAGAASILVQEVDAATGDAVGSPVTGTYESTQPVGYSFYDQPSWWGAEAKGATELSLLHVASLGDGSLVTVNGVVYDHVWEDASTLKSGERVVAKVASKLDPEVLNDVFATVAEPFGVRMFYAGVKQASTDYWYSRELDYQNVTAELEEEDVNVQNRASTTVVDTPHSAITCLKEVPNGLLVGTLDGRVHGLFGRTPETGTFRLISEVGSPPRSWGYALVAGQVYYMPVDGRGVIFAGLDGVDAVSFAHLRHPTRGQRMRRGGEPGRAIGSPYNQFVLLSRQHETDLTGKFPFSTLEFHNSVWVVGEVLEAPRVDYCMIPGGKIGRAVHDGRNLKLYVRDETWNAPVSDDSDWGVPLGDEENLSGTTVSNVEAGYATVLLPELRLAGVPKLTIEGLVIEVDYWKRSGVWSPELYVHVHMLREDNDGSLAELSDVDWATPLGIVNHMPSDLPAGSGVRLFVDVKEALAKLDKVFAGEYPSGYAMQVALRFKELSVHRVVPRINTIQWKQYVDVVAALGAVSRWGGGGQRAGQ